MSIIIIMLYFVNCSFIVETMVATYSTVATGGAAVSGSARCHTATFTLYDRRFVSGWIPNHHPTRVQKRLWNAQVCTGTNMLFHRMQLLHIFQYERMFLFKRSYTNRHWRLYITRMYSFNVDHSFSFTKHSIVNPWLKLIHIFETNTISSV